MMLLLRRKLMPLTMKKNHQKPSKIKKIKRTNKKMQS